MFQPVSFTNLTRFLNITSCTRGSSCSFLSQYKPKDNTGKIKEIKQEISEKK